MSTTTIRLPEELKARVAAAAARAGTSAHGFILEAIAEKTAQAERQNAFDAEADQRYATLIQRGETISWSEMRRYLEARVRGETAARPAVRKPTP
ncbi:MAG: ribbon-helix-helix protein, CopG family [Thauera phenolivorans]|uniref:Ribbon-helix-helix protein, CopG family n=1 Tax=Thauera phenolivorans TaxID=1792543 RepID=A0A7X7R6Z9_9RHOO|nr:ribbon-helix-helix protein, CopG family [Thauera phenolivorans]NLF53066.1 ribbon-helix-helix protein, CopG family [Thauera phenolivorans]